MSNTYFELVKSMGLT
jgi:hypothetical protein